MATTEDYVPPAHGFRTFVIVWVSQSISTLGNGTVKKGYWANIKEGTLYIWQRSPLLWLLGMIAVANLVGSSRGVFTPLIVKFNLTPDWSAHGFSFETALALLRVEDKAYLDRLAAQAEGQEYADTDSIAASTE
jgi:hypothetical protein